MKVIHSAMCDFCGKFDIKDPLVSGDVADLAYICMTCLSEATSMIAKHVGDKIRKGEDK